MLFAGAAATAIATAPLTMAQPAPPPCFNADGTPYQSGGAPSEGLAWVDPEHSVGDSSRTKGEFGSSVSR